ncbi:MAG TPA: CBS domain-containing protein [Thermoanaerobaculia bacterium]|nr:CBS domain-containing protein [Thermoanaerobaculia bacterium]
MSASPPRPAAPPPHEGFFLSEFLGAKVLDVARVPVGRISDLVVDTGVKSSFPKITGLLLRDRFETFVLPWEDVAIFQRGSVRTRLSREDLIHRAPLEEEILLAKHLLDKQIVDINGVKVVRVNDLKLDIVSGDLVLTAADVGPRGFIRRVFGSGVTPRGGRFSDASIPSRLIPWDSMQPLTTKLDRLETRLPHEKLARLHPADIAEILTQVPLPERSGIFRKLDVETAAETLHELEPEVQVELIEEMPAPQASDILEQMPADEAADVLGDLPGEQAKDLVQLMEKEAAEEVQELLVHDDNTAGGLMGTSWVAFPPGLIVRDALAKLRALAREEEVITYFYVVDERERPTGVLSVRELLAAEDDQTLESVMTSPVRSVTPDVPADEVAETMSKYDLLALPVTDPEGVLVGLITIDDVFDRLKERPPRRRRGR